MGEKRETKSFNGRAIAFLCFFAHVSSLSSTQLQSLSSFLLQLYLLCAVLQIWSDILLFALANAVGQCFIFYIMRAFSPVVLVTLTVTRKFFSILFSIVRFGHAVSKLIKWNKKEMMPRSDHKLIALCFIIHCPLRLFQF